MSTVFLALAAATVVTASPAHADDGPTCTEQQEIVARWKSNAWAYVYVTTCVSYSGGVYYSSAFIHWRGAGGASEEDGNRVFEKFKLTVRLEQYVNGADKVISTETCDYRGLINTTPSVPKSGAFSCALASSRTRTGTWSTDGKVVYNVDSDGIGDGTHQFQGTHRID